MSIAAIIVAAGRGARAGGGLPKQFRALGQRPMLSWSLRAFADTPAVDAVVPIIGHGFEDDYHAAANGIGKLRAPVTGGETRQASVLAGLEALSADPPDHVLIHDAARPFIDRATIMRVCHSLETHRAALPALAVTDTLKRAHGGTVETVSRAGLHAAQTPQGFQFDAILRAHRQAAEQGLQDFTDDAAIAEWAGLDLALVEGAAGNMKITSEDDLIRAQVQALGDVRTGHGFDVHAFKAGRPLMLGGIEIAHDKGLKGHSDADVALHALADAIFGALADGDIGAHFPPGEAVWKDAASERFVAFARDRVHARGGMIAHVDLTIICEAPKIGPHRDAMRARIADILQIDHARVAVKATTTEGLGFTGRGEGIAAQAVATLRLPHEAF